MVRSDPSSQGRFACRPPTKWIRCINPCQSLFESRVSRDGVSVGQPHHLDGLEQDRRSDRGAQEVAAVSEVKRDRQAVDDRSGGILFPSVRTCDHGFGKKHA